MGNRRDPPPNRRQVLSTARENSRKKLKQEMKVVRDKLDATTIQVARLQDEQARFKDDQCRLSDVLEKKTDDIAKDIAKVKSVHRGLCKDLN